MQLVMNEVNNDFLFFLKGEIASKGIKNTSLRDLFFTFIRIHFSGQKFINELTHCDRQTLFIENIDNSLVITFKFIIENVEYLEVEAAISDKNLKIMFSESLDNRLLYDSEIPLELSLHQFVYKQNVYGMTLGSIFNILFHSLFTADLNNSVKNSFNLTNMYDQFNLLQDNKDQKTYDHITRNDIANIWIF